MKQEDIETLEILGHVYFLQGRAKEANIVFNGILALNDNNESALRHLAALSLDEGNGSEALRRIDACASADSALWLMRAKALHMEDRKAEAAESMAEYVRRNQADR
ncbi:MAG: hypothetical protein LBV80_02700 [Deltaproteobacteria bacterium]|jgi:predicted Zn-dependent protease|nr:hypothetical protein [Deltaproteobacteria bacterium]